MLLGGCPPEQRSSESEHDRIFQELERLKAEAQAAEGLGENIKVVVNMLSVSDRDRFAIDSLLEYVDEHVAIVKRPEVMSQSGLKIGVGNEHFKAQVEITKTQVKSSEDTELFIVLADGTTGYINIGREISVPQFYHMGKRYSSVGYAFRQAGRSLRVTARKLPAGLIDLELTPVFSKFLSNGGDLELTELSTRVRCQAGQTLVIGGGDTAGENVAKALLSYSKTGEMKETLITVTPYIQ